MRARSRPGRRGPGRDCGLLTTGLLGQRAKAV